MNNSKLEYFIDYLDREWSWRRKEVTSYDQLLAFAEDYQKPILQRASIPFLYSHWEGFVKASSRKLLKSYSNHKINTVPRHIVLSFLMKEFESRQCNKMYLKIADTSIECLSNENIEISKNINEIINVHSNLDSQELKNILKITGIDHNPFSLREKFIDYSLLGNRNKIAHGEGIAISYDDYLKIKRGTIEIIELFKEEITNIAIKYNNIYNSSMRGISFKFL
ncbi:MAE_28990/MAE_18760 family HEPN-like nuclease [Bilophila wadsworthia]|uniref:MAE_28990/MAE_18760 family HEPN-like nuclease n=1 Tax=Bilophila wadsworthia TaxID=35833 RepID=UPI0027B93752|nr:MAE_28990/MAE_18760 family HEPN-like nuclease [Bilophila wadsworthia]